MDKLNILYIDDSPAQLDAMRKALTGGPYDLSTATGAKLALNRASQADIIIIDYNMPGINGEQCLKMLRDQQEEGRIVRYYLYTSDPAAFKRHKEMGFDGVLMLKGKTVVRNQIDAIARALKLSRWTAA